MFSDIHLPFGSKGNLTPEEQKSKLETITARLGGVSKKIEAIKNNESPISSIPLLKGIYVKFLESRQTKLQGEVKELQAKISPKPQTGTTHKTETVERRNKPLPALPTKPLPKEPGEEIVSKILNRDVVETRGGGKVPLFDVLLTRNASVIPTADLFERIIDVLDKAKPADQELLLNFAAKWVERNKGTKEFPKGQEALERMAKMEGLPKDAIQKFQEALNAERTIESPPTFTEGSVKTADILHNVRAGALAGTNYEAAVERFAQDLFIINSSNYNRLEPDDLVKNKWDQTPAAVKEIRDSFNELAGFVRNAILLDNTPESQERAVQFFIDIADACKKRGNIEALKAIIGALGDITTVSVKDPRFAEMKDFLSDTKQHLRDFYAKSDSAIPFIGTFLTDIEKGETIDASNPSKLVTLQTAEQQLLKFKGQTFGNTISTDLYTSIKDLKSTQDEQVNRALDIKYRDAIQNLKKGERAQYAALLKGEGLIGKQVSENVKTAIRATRNLEIAAAGSNKAEVKAVTDKFDKINALINPPEVES